jgi:hypothetical protein
VSEITELLLRRLTEEESKRRKAEQQRAYPDIFGLQDLEQFPLEFGLESMSEFLQFVAAQVEAAAAAVSGKLDTGLPPPQRAAMALGLLHDLTGKTGRFRQLENSMVRAEQHLGKVAESLTDVPASRPKRPTVQPDEQGRSGKP